MTRKNLWEIVQLSDRLGWDYTRQELDLALQTGRLFGFQKGNAGVVATSGIFPWPGLASLGMVMVHPEFRRMGLGRRVTEAALKMIPDIPVMLVATDEGKTLYEKLGFRTVDHLYKLVATSLQGEEIPPPNGLTLSPVTPGDLKAILTLDRKTFKADRSVFLKQRIHHRSACGFKLETGSGQITGYALGFQNPGMLVIGPVVAPAPQPAFHLIHQIALRHQGKMRVDIFPDPFLLEQLQKSEFQLVRTPPVMLKNRDALPFRPHLYAVAAQAYG